MLSIKNLTVFVSKTPILKGLFLALGPGEIHAIMGPNGSGKSTLVQTIAGNPQYETTAGEITFEGSPLNDCSPAERAQRGIFLSFQQPPAIPGLSVFSLLKEMRQALSKEPVDLVQFQEEVKRYLTLLTMDHSFLERACNDGFSGGEKKRLELLQLMVAKPKVILLDEIDSGLDIDALKLVARVVEQLRTENPSIMVLIITHYQRLLEYIVPDKVHVLVNGQIKTSADAALIAQIEQRGYDGYRKQDQA